MADSHEPLAPRRSSRLNIHYEHIPLQRRARRQEIHLHAPLPPSRSSSPLTEQSDGDEVIDCLSTTAEVTVASMADSPPPLNTPTPILPSTEVPAIPTQPEDASGSLLPVGAQEEPGLVISSTNADASREEECSPETHSAPLSLPVRCVQSPTPAWLVSFIDWKLRSSLQEMRCTPPPAASMGSPVSPLSAPPTSAPVAPSVTTPTLPALSMVSPSAYLDAHYLPSASQSLAFTRSDNTLLHNFRIGGAYRRYLHHKLIVQICADLHLDRKHPSTTSARVEHGGQQLFVTMDDVVQWAGTGQRDCVRTYANHKKLMERVEGEISVGLMFLEMGIDCPDWLMHFDLLPNQVTWPITTDCYTWKYNTLLQKLNDLRS